MTVPPKINRPRAISEDVEFEAVATTQSWPTCLAYVAQLASFSFDAFLAHKNDERFLELEKRNSESIDRLEKEITKIKNANAFRSV